MCSVCLVDCLCIWFSFLSELYELLFLVRLVLQSSCCDTAISLKQINIFPVDFSLSSQTTTNMSSVWREEQQKSDFWWICKTFLFSVKLLWNFWWSCKTFYGRVDHLSPLPGCPPIWWLCRQRKVCTLLSDNCDDESGWAFLGCFTYWWQLVFLV